MQSDSNRRMAASGSYRMQILRWLMLVFLSIFTASNALSSLTLTLVERFVIPDDMLSIILASATWVKGQWKGQGHIIKTLNIAWWSKRGMLSFQICRSVYGRNKPDREESEIKTPRTCINTILKGKIISNSNTIIWELLVWEYMYSELNNKP
jgi:hypothetical protein